MKRFSFLGTGAVAVLCLSALNPVLKADEYNRQTFITTSQPLEVPGAVLPPGTYVMRLFNSSSNRNIVQFMTEDRKKQLALTFTVPAERVNRTDKTVLTMYEGTAGSPPALHIWFWPGDTAGQEFLYPHDQAQRISQRTNVVVPEATADTQPTISAEAEAAAAAAPVSEPVQVAAAPVEITPTREPVVIARAEPAPAPVAAPEPQQPAADDRTIAQESAPTPDSLPQTAGYGPLAGLIGGLSVALAFGVRKMRRRR